MPKTAPQPPPAEQMLMLSTGYWISQLVYVVAELGIADLLAKQSQTADALAAKTGVHARSLRRVLRALAGVGVLRLGRDGRFALTRLGATLRSDTPDSARDFARMMVAGYNWQAWEGLLAGVRTGRLPFDDVHRQPIFGYLQAHPADERIFAAAMASISRTENPAVARGYDFGKLRELVDVGGSQGHLLAAILRRHRKLRGVLFDQPQVVDAAREAGYVTAREVDGRCRIAAGSFFEGVPAGADGYLMKYILHDWDDERCVQILGHIRRAMAPGGRVLVVEHVVSNDSRMEMGKMLDINMLVLTGGCERTRDEFAALLRKADLRLRRVVPTESRVSVVEGVAA